MDLSSLVVPSDTHESINNHKIFFVVNIVLMLVFIFAGIGWAIYAKKKEKWPYQKYVRNSGPAGTQPISKINLNFPEDDSSITSKAAITIQEGDTTQKTTTTSNY